MSVSFDVDTRRLNHILRGLGGNTRKAVRKIAFRVEAEAKKNIRAHGLIDTGAMVNSVYVTMQGDANTPPAGAADNPNGIVVPLPTPSEGAVAHVGPSVHYAIYHEFGTTRIPARPYLGPAVNTVADEVEQNPELFRGVVTGE